MPGIMRGAHGGQVLPTALVNAFKCISRVSAMHALALQNKPESNRTCSQQVPEFIQSVRLQDLLNDTIRNFFRVFSGSAVTTQDLLCHLAHALAGCSIDSTHSHGSCEDVPNLHPRTIHSEQAPDQPHRGCEMVGFWLLQLQAWLEEPGVQVVELGQEIRANGLQVQATLLENEIPGQVSFPAGSMEDIFLHQYLLMPCSLHCLCHQSDQAAGRRCSSYCILLHFIVYVFGLFNLVLLFQ